MNAPATRTAPAARYFEIETTDTFSGEPNFCWRRVHYYRAASMRGAISAHGRENGGGWRLNFNAGDFARYDMRGACVCAFVREIDAEELPPDTRRRFGLAALAPVSA